ncbi:Lectin C-type domain-containing protein [Nannocystis exedens]|uniref:Lectin C-type domain-containing protein n=1 Tax=Nannocystis exedens TaxID=54 RepID=A0A1I2AAJ9_9BACT|nr:MopE-related protein [Nannocystis exedens]PCC69730.1 Protein metal binding site [Nannocystis exedens]SFE40892.1 Lectin C-type domain-containing protein [Nannocystis exedens]
MRPVAGVVLALCVLAGCFSDTTPQLSTGGPTSTSDAASTTSTSTSLDTATSSTSTSTSTSTPTEVTTTDATTTGGCPMGQPPKSWYLDGDGDGFGAGEPVAVACDAPAGAVDSAGDCDDLVFEINPGAAELCNMGVDDDCDGLVDEYSADNLACGTCSLSEFGGAVSWVCSESLAFTAAEAFCQQFGAAVHLVHPENATELAFVRDRIFDHLGEVPAELRFWTGLHRREALWDECTTNPDATDWVALDGAPVTYLPWRDGAPDNAECFPLCTTELLEDPGCPRENCIELGEALTGAFNDFACSMPAAGLVCQARLGDP